MIVVEGADGAGKATQVAILKKKFESLGKKVVVYDFPQYEKTYFGAKVGEFLRGNFGKLREVHPLLPAVLYAGDRWESAAKIRADLGKGKIVICNRYMTATLGHGTAKLSSWADRRKFIKDMEKMEYEILGIPKPALVIYLYVPAMQAQKLLDTKQKRKYLKGEDRDMAEKDIEHQKQSIEVFKWLCRNRKEIVEVNCMGKGGGLLSIEEIGEKVWKVVNGVVDINRGSN